MHPAPSIVQDGAPVLRSVAVPVPDEDFGTPAFARLVADMAAALDAAPDGVAIAAPQIGVGQRVFLVRYDRFAERPEDGSPLPAEVGVFANPRIVRTAKRRAEMDEGCLSVRGIFGKTRRFTRATVQAQDAEGRSFERGGGGILAQIFQHEIDHLDGILFIDHATDLVRAVQEPAPDDAPVA